ncbi:MAG: BamA/TamA family outer membrane protein [Bacteroidetes bacterium]|nr:BamA/TamA family outer membrane protein [Bacteroidota bacterium]
MIKAHKILKKGTAACMALFLFLSACKTTHSLKEGQYLLDQNIIQHNTSEIASSDIAPYIRQQPNRRLVTINVLGIRWFPYYLWLYNSIDSAKMAQVKAKRDAKYDKINAKRLFKAEAKNRARIAKGKKTKEPKLKDKTELTWRESWIQNGEPPSLLDSGLIKTSKEQIKKFLFTKGYFNAVIQDSVALFKHRKKAKVYYQLHAGIPHQISAIRYEIEDPLLKYYVLQDSVNCLIERGMRYDADVLSAERERLVKQQRNNGYYGLNTGFVLLLVDTNLPGNNVNVTINIKRNTKGEDSAGNSIYSNHTRYYINHIYVVTDYDIFNRNKSYTDTSSLNDVRFLYNKKLFFKKKDIANKIFFYKGELFNNDKVDETYSRLTSMKAFKSVTLDFKPDEKKTDQINSYVLMAPNYKQNFSIETDGTNTSGNLGAELSVVYQNRNIFKGSELLEIKLKGGLIAQKNFASQSNENAPTYNKFLQAFNTVQFGPEVNLNFPKALFPFSLIKFYKNAAPTTIASSSFNYQQNSLYSRALTSISYGLRFNGKRFIKHSIVPFEVNLIKALLSDGFAQQLILDSNRYLSNSFKSHLTTVSRYTFIYNNQTSDIASMYKAFSFLKADIESSGNIMRGLYNLAGAQKNTQGQYEILNVPFAQFLRFDVDYRVYKSVKKLGRFVFRMMGGMGYALQNLNAMPYEKSFYGGGPNDVRAWTARSLGPGSSNPLHDKYNDKIGDIQIELNFEYRFKIYKWLNGAYFIDAGNIWMRQKDPTRPGADFALNRFYKEFATGTGIGIRADFTYFILRVDGAFKVYNPTYPEGQRWVFGGGNFFRSFIPNFGIGYPF